MIIHTVDELVLSSLWNRSQMLFEKYRKNMERWRLSIFLPDEKFTHKNLLRNMEKLMLNIVSSADITKVSMNVYLSFLMSRKYRSGNMCSRVESSRALSGSIVLCALFLELSVKSLSWKSLFLQNSEGKKNIHTTHVQKHSSDYQYQRFFFLEIRKKSVNGITDLQKINSLSIIGL